MDIIKRNYFGLGLLLMGFCTSLCLSCNGKEEQPVREEQLRAFTARDTIDLELIRFKSTFYGKYTLRGPGLYRIDGEVQGDIRADTLIGNIYYTPYKWRDKKRRAFSLLEVGDRYLIGKGSETIYMGIPHFIEKTLSYDSLGYFSARK